MTEMENSHLKSFEHMPLPGPSYIRLLQMLEPADDGTLRFDLIPHDIDGDVRKTYYCLSYTWGNPFAHGVQFREHFDAVGPEYGEGNQVPVIINGLLAHIQKNLYDALSIIPRPQNTFHEYTNRPLDGTIGRRYLHLAAARGQVSSAETWLSRGADINMLDDEDHNALHYAAFNGKPDCIPMLLRNGCRADAKDMNGQTPVDLARAEGHDKAVSLLEEAARQPNSNDQGAEGKIYPVQETVYIWADAICINQGDIDEKSAQVTMMDRIYSTATYVIAWLGPRDEHSTVGIQTLNTLQSHLKAFRDSQIEPFSGKDKDRYEDAGVPHISGVEWASLASIYQRQWFRRAWIVQEAVLPVALLMYLGEDAIPWGHLGQVAQAISHLETKLGTVMSTSFVPIRDVAVPVTSNVSGMFVWRQIRALACEGLETTEENRKLFTLSRLLEHLWTFLASDPRDKVFACYGLLNLFATERRIADYRLSLATVYTMATRELIMEEGSLQVLSSCIYHLHRRSGLPSWVPDFGLQGKNSIPSRFSADKGLEYTPPKAVDPSCGVLHVKGVFLGVISQVGGRPGTEVGEKTKFDRSWLTMTLSLRGKGGHGEKIYLSWILWTTLCMNMSAGGMSDPELYGDAAPDEQGLDFRFFMLLLILSAADGKIREKLGLEATTTKPGLVYSHLDYDPMKEDMEPVLKDLDALAEHDGPESCWTPSREEVLRYWNDFKFNMYRNTELEWDSGPADFYLPSGVTQENSRPVGRGHVLLGSRVARKCFGFISAYMLMYGGRHLIIVGEKLLGMASLAVKPGDQVWILPGLNAPAVLRSVKAESSEGSSGKKEGSRFEFIGSSYINGLMGGGQADRLKDGLKDLELV